MTRCFALALTTLICACGSSSATDPNSAPALVIVDSRQANEANAPEVHAPRSTVPMTADDQKQKPMDAALPATRLYWFFGSR
mgnify:CR=1 FL=1